MNNEFKQYAVKHLGMSRTRLESYMNITSQRGGGYSPTIIEERQQRRADGCFTRLMMDRTFLGTAIDDYTANVMQAQLPTSTRPTPGRTSPSVNSPAAPFTAWPSTTPYSLSRAMSLSAPVSRVEAAVLLVAGTPKKRFALTHSRVMMHQPMGGVQGSVRHLGSPP